MNINKEKITLPMECVSISNIHITTDDLLKIKNVGQVLKGKVKLEIVAGANIEFDVIFTNPYVMISKYKGQEITKEEYDELLKELNISEIEEIK